ncbi:MAG: hypothetical protein KDA84_01850, partial [Planctomycetaceae bacterium]|nr:hypothetical protein [Planctomycetaceae bacterium]
DYPLYSILESFWLWHAYTVVGEKAEANREIEATLKNLARMESSDDALSAGGELAGWLVQYKQDDLALQALKLARVAGETSQHTWTFTEAYFAALAHLLGKKNLAREWHQQARSHDRIPENRDMIFYGVSRQFDEAMAAMRQMPHNPSYTSIVAIAAAVANREDDFVLAKRRAIANLPSWEKTRGQNLDGVRTNLVAADSLMGNFDLAERRAASLSDKPPYHWKSRADSYLARDYALAGKLNEAKRAIGKTTLCPQGEEAHFYYWRARARAGERLSTLYRDAISTNSSSSKIAALCGLVCGLSKNTLPTRHKRDFMFF